MVAAGWGAGRIDKRMDGEADREKIKLFLSFFCKRTVFFLKKMRFITQH